MQARFLDDAVRNDRKVRPLQMVCEARANITWYRIPGTAWTAQQAQRRIDEARTWFDRYCIHLNFSEFALDLSKTADQRIKRELDALVPEYNALVARIQRAAPAPESRLHDVQAKLLSIYNQLARKAGNDRLVVIFLDEWYVLVGNTDDPSHWRDNRVSANDGQRLLIGIDRYDTDSRHILTHELTHALRKQVNPGNAQCLRSFIQTNGVTITTIRPWQDHYGGANQDQAMTHPTRSRAFRPFNKADSCVLTVLEYLTLLRGGYVRATPGCQCEERREQKKEGRAR